MLPHICKTMNNSRVFYGHSIYFQEKLFNKKYLRSLYSKTCLKLPLKNNTKMDFQYQVSLNAGQKYCRILQGEHSEILSTFIKLPFSIKTFVLSIFKWPLKTGFTVIILQVMKLVAFIFEHSSYSSAFQTRFFSWKQTI